MSQNTLHAPSRCNSRLVVPLEMFEMCNPANADFILHPTFLILLTLIFCQTLANPCPIPRIAFHTMRTAHTEPKPHRLVEFNHKSHLKVSFKWQSKGRVLEVEVFKSVQRDLLQSLNFYKNLSNCSEILYKGMKDGLHVSPEFQHQPLDGQQQMDSGAHPRVSSRWNLGVKCRSINTLLFRARQCILNGSWFVIQMWSSSGWWASHKHTINGTAPSPRPKYLQHQKWHQRSM